MVENSVVDLESGLVGHLVYPKVDHLEDSLVFLKVEWKVQTLVDVMDYVMVV